MSQPLLLSRVVTAELFFLVLQKYDPLRKRDHGDALGQWDSKDAITYCVRLAGSKITTGVVSH